MDYIDGKWVEPFVLMNDYVLEGVHVGTIKVQQGHFELRGVLQGTLSLQAGTSATISGKQEGTVSLSSGSTIRVTGSIDGTVRVNEGAELVIESGGKLAGALSNEGLVIVRGAFGGPQSGQGEIRLEENGFVKPPRIVEGVYYYDW